MNSFSKNIYTWVVNLTNSFNPVPVVNFCDECCCCGGSCSCENHESIVKFCDECCCCGGSCSCENHNSVSSNRRDWSSIKRADVPLAWGLYFQDGASPSFEGIVDLHNRIMFYLVVILFGVSWVMISIMWNFNKGNNKLVYRYLNHGKYVPTQKCFKFKWILSKVFIRSYTTLPNKNLGSSINNKIVRLYEDAFNMRKSFK